MHLGAGEILVVLVIALLVFGPTKLPQLGDALGKGIRNFKRATMADDATPVVPVEPSPTLPAGGGAARAATAASAAAVERSVNDRE